MGMTADDWTNQIRVMSATLAGTPNYYDAGNYPSAAIFNPAGNIAPECAYLAWFAPTYANLSFSGLGGYSYGRANLADHSDTTKHMRWYTPPPHSFVPDGFTVTQNGIAHMVDLDVKQVGGAEVYQDSVIYGRGVWNNDTKDFDYTFSTLAFPCKAAKAAADVKIAASPNGNHVWISVLTSFAGGNPGMHPLIDSTYYPLLRHSFDGGLNWSDPIPVYLDGPNGITGIKNTYSDYFIMNLFTGPPWPTRDEIPYTTAFDHSLSVDKWGGLHIGVAVGYAPGGYQISTGIDSLINVYDIVTCDYGSYFEAICMGPLKTLRGTWGAYSCDNRVYVSSTKAGEKMFFTWNDTRVDGVTNNQNPDIWARGFDLFTSRITSVNGLNAPHNVTFQSSIANEAYWQCTSPRVFTDNNKYTIPISTQWFTDPTEAGNFKYIPDFSFVDADFTINIPYAWPCWKSDLKIDDPDPVTPTAGASSPCWGVNIKPNAEEPALLTIYPNPVDDILNLTLNLKQNATVTIRVTNLFGQPVVMHDKGRISAGTAQFTLDLSRLPAGLYCVTATINGERVSTTVAVN
jgi:hypothetical protein